MSISTICTVTVVPYLYQCPMITAVKFPFSFILWPYAVILTITITLNFISSHFLYRSCFYFSLTSKHEVTFITLPDCQVLANVHYIINT
jgi:hypothetical protein